jgi:hypothetical protein
MGKYMLPISVIFLGLCLVLGAWIISRPTTETVESSQALNETVEDNGENQYEFITIANDYFIIFDKQTEQYWHKIGSSEWEKQQSITPSK